MKGLLIGLQSYYKLDESSGDRADSLGAHNLTQVGTISSTTGKINNGIVTSSSASNYLNGGDIHNYADITISCWLKLDAAALKYWFYRTGNTYLVYGSGDQTQAIRWYLTLSDNSNVELNCSAVTLGTWYHWVFQYSNTTYKSRVYKNTTNVGAATYSLPRKNTAENFYLGAPDLPGVINIDEMGVWNRILTTSEIAALYNNNNGLTYPFNSACQTSILVGSGSATGSLVSVKV